MVTTRVPNKKFWNKKKIFITGHTSFKGTWLKIWLEKLGSNITGYSNSYPSNPLSLYKIIYKFEKIRKKDDINDYNNLLNSLQMSKPEIVFHLAAQSIVSEASQKPIDTFKSNIMGTVNLIEACLKVKTIKIIMIVTTDKCYEENNDSKSYKESSNLGGSEPYSASKAAVELITKSYLKKFKEMNKKVVTLRAGNVIGGGDWKKNRLVPDIYKFIYEKKKLVFRNLKGVRPWQHVLDCLNGYILATEYASKNSYHYNNWNFSPDLKYQKNVKWIVDKIIEMNNLNIKYRKENMKFYESQKLTLSAKKANTNLYWSTLINNQLLINYVNDWYKSYYLNISPRELCLNQIQNFYRLVNKKII